MALLNNGESQQNGEPLISNQRDKPRPFIVSDSVSYYTKSELEQMRGMGYKVEPTIDPNKNAEIDSIVTILGSIVVCEICEDSTPEEQKVRGGPMRGIYRIGYHDGSFRIVCADHRPEQTEEKIPWDWTNH